MSNLWYSHLCLAPFSTVTNFANHSTVAACLYWVVAERLLQRRRPATWRSKLNQCPPRARPTTCTVHRRLLLRHSLPISLESLMVCICFTVLLTACVYFFLVCDNLLLPKTCLMFWRKALFSALICVYFWPIWIWWGTHEVNGEKLSTNRVIIKRCLYQQWI